jgi:hypothetical protein
MRALAKLVSARNLDLVKRSLDGSTESTDPGTPSPDDFRNAGHEDRPVLQTIRAKCLDCCCYQAIEVRRCTATRCSLWPYRMATNPFAKPRGSGKPFSPAKPRQIGGEISASGEARACHAPDDEGMTGAAPMATPIARTWTGMLTGIVLAVMVVPSDIAYAHAIADIPFGAILAIASDLADETKASTTVSS